MGLSGRCENLGAAKMTLITRCPKCQNDFLVTLEQLRMHEGLVRCGACLNIFDAKAHLESDLPTLTARAQESAQNMRAAEMVPDTTRVAPEAAVLRFRSDMSEPAYESLHAPVHEPAYESLREPARKSVSASDPPERPEPSMTVRADVPSHVVSSMRVDPPMRADPSMRADPPMRAPTAGSRSGTRAPDFLHHEEGPGLAIRLVWMIASVLALLGLIGQGVYIYRNDIATSLPFVRPALNSMCAKLGCDVSLVRHPERIAIEASSLQQSPAQIQDGQATELSLRITMRNRYNKNQPWPHLSLELKDASGAMLVRKNIAPHQYLPSTLIDQPFAAGQEVNLLIPVTASGLQINGFQLNTFFP